MMIRPRPLMAVLILTLVLIPPEVMAKKNHRTRETVMVEDYTAPVWDGIVAETVADFNAIMPAKGARLVYVRREPTPCALPVPTQAITVCSGPLAEGYSGIAFWDPGGAPGTGHIHLSESAPNAAYRAMAACHEFMHILTRIPDNYGGNPDSCVWGLKGNPGEFDVKKLIKVYDDKRRHR